MYAAERGKSKKSLRRQKRSDGWSAVERIKKKNNRKEKDHAKREKKTEAAAVANSDAGNVRCRK